MTYATTFPTAGEFLQTVRPFLERQPGVTDLMLGLAIGLAPEPLLYGSPPFFAAVLDEHELQLAALMTPPHNLILHAEGEPQQETLDALAHSLQDGGWAVNGVLAPVPVAQRFADLWTRLTGQSSRAGLKQRVYILRGVDAVAPAAGCLRPALDTDGDQVLDWMRAFHAEAVPGHPASDPGLTLRRIDARQIWLWEDGAPASMAMQSRPTGRGVSIGAVYTPPALRGRGYATACVASLSRQLLDAGYDYCTLFTDLSNPTSNAIYQQIGYRAARDFEEFLFGGEV